MEISVIPRMTIIVGDWRFDNLTISRPRIQDCMKLTGSRNINQQSLHTVGTKKRNAPRLVIQKWFNIVSVSQLSDEIKFHEMVNVLWTINETSEFYES